MRQCNDEMQRGGKTREGTPYQQYTMQLCSNQPNRAGGVTRGKDTTQLQKDTRCLVTMRQDATTRCREQTKCEGEGRGDAAHEMSQEEFDQLVAARSEATPAAGLGGGRLEPSDNTTAERMITCPYSTENAAPRMYRSMICQRGMQMGFKGITKGFRCYLYIIIMMNHGKKIGMRIMVDDNG